MNEILAKPFTKNDFIEKISSYLQSTANPSITEGKSLTKTNEYNYTSIDIQEFQRLVNDVSISSALELMDYFQKTLPETRETIDKMFKGGELEELSKQCHSVKGSALSLGAPKLGKYCDMIAHHMDELKKDEIESTISNILYELENLKKEVPQLIAAKS